MFFRFLFRVAVFLVVIGLVLYLYGQYQLGRVPKPPETIALPPTPGPAVVYTPVPGWVPPGQERPAPLGAPVSLRSTPAPAGPPPPGQPASVNWNGIASAAGVKITSLVSVGSKSIVAIEGPSHVETGDFVDRAVKTGKFRDFSTSSMSAGMVAGRQVYRVTCTFESY